MPWRHAEPPLHCVDFALHGTRHLAPLRQGRRAGARRGAARRPATRRSATCSTTCRSATRTGGRSGRWLACALPAWCTLRARLRGVRAIRTRKRGLTIVRGLVEDGTGALAVTWFNRPWLANQVEEGREYLLHGQVRLGKTGFELLNPTCERAEEAIHSARIVPIYPSAGKLGPAALRRVLREALTGIDLEREVPEHLPEELLRRYALPPLGRALRALHAPDDDEDVARLNSRRSPPAPAADLRRVPRAAARARAAAGARGEAGQGPRLRDRRPGARAWRARSCPFKLTEAQKRVLREIADDLRGPYPMLRLLQGDVGSGKTIVAALALVLAIESGLQGAFMAPTELLAEQHFGNLRRLLGSRYRLALFTGSVGPSAARPPGAGARRRAARGRHPRPDPGRSRVPPPGAGGDRRAAPLRRAAAPDAAAQGRASRRAGDDRDADPALAGAHRLRRPRDVAARRAAARAHPGGDRGAAGERAPRGLRAAARRARGGRAGLRRLPADRGERPGRTPRRSPRWGRRCAPSSAASRAPCCTAAWRRRSARRSCAPSRAARSASWSRPR